VGCACIYKFGNKKFNESPDTIIWYDDILPIGNKINSRSTWINIEHKTKTKKYEFQISYKNVYII